MKKLNSKKLIKFVKIFSLVGLTLPIILVSFKDKNHYPRKEYSSEQLFRGIIFMKGPVSSTIPEVQDRLEVKNLVITNKEQIKQEIKIEDLIVKQIKKCFPEYLEEFKTEVTSGDPQRINLALEKTQDIIMRSLASYLGLQLNNITSAKEQISKIMARNQNEFQSAIADFQMKKIDEKEFDKRIHASLNVDKDKLKSIFPGDQISDAAIRNANKELCGGCAAFLSFLACNVAVAINVAGYINLALAVNIAVAIDAAVAVNITIEVQFNSSKGINDANRNSLLEHESYINSIATNLAA